MAGIDLNQNIISHEAKKYFHTEVEASNKVNQTNKIFLWEDIEKRLVNGEQPGADLIRKLEFMHIVEEEWDEDDLEFCRESAAMFWQWVPKLMRLVGRYVKELTIELAEELEESNDVDNIHNMKINFLSSMASTFPALKALQLTGSGLSISEPGLRKEYIQLVKNVKIVNLEYLRVEKRVSSSHLLAMIQNQLLRSPMLTEVRASIKQLACPLHPCVLQSVTTLRLADYGYELTINTPEFAAFFKTMFPSVKNLWIIETMNDVVPNLPKFLCDLYPAIKLEQFGMDQSGRKFFNDDNTKIRGIPNIRVDLKAYLSSHIQMLDHVGDTPEIVLENWECAKVRNLTNPQELKKSLALQVQLKMPSLEYVVMISSKGHREIVNLE